MLFGFEQKRFWRDALDSFLALTLLDCAMVLLPGGSGRHFKVLERRGSSPLLEERQPELLALAPHLFKPSALVDEDRVLLLVPLRIEGVTQALLCGVRRHPALPFSSHDIVLVTEMAEKMLTALSQLEPADPPPPRPRATPGLVAERYLCGLKLLQGRFSALYGAFDQQAKIHVLLRKLEGIDLGREARQHLLAEGRFLARLEHPNLPRFLDTVDDSSGLYLVLEAFSGSTLEQKHRNARKPLSQQTVQAYLGQFLDVLGFLHQQSPPLIQRDLRPDNIMSTSQGVLKLLDFGLARLKDSPCDPRETYFRGFGDPVYASPEQLSGQPSLPAHDLYAVGSILYFLASGETPPRASDRWDGSGLEVRLGELRPDLPLWLVEVVEWLRHPQIDQRPPHAEAVRDRCQF
ncbi:serine/threonine protein kinase [bacterium]|nr:serine/threonine protein kinase [bacterium]